MGTSLNKFERPQRLGSFRWPFQVRTEGTKVKLVGQYNKVQTAVNCVVAVHWINRGSQVSEFLLWHFCWTFYLFHVYVSSASVKYIYTDGKMSM